MAHNLNPTDAISNSLLFVGTPSEQVSSLLELLDQQNYKITQINLNQDISEYLATSSPDLILLGYDLSEENCDFFQQYIRESKFPKIPFIYICEHPDKLDFSEVFKYGCADYLLAPFHLEEAIARISYQLKIVRLQQELDATHDSLQEILQEFKTTKHALHQLNLEPTKTSDVGEKIPLMTHHRFKEYLDREWGNSSRERILLGDSSQSKLSLILCCVDNFVADKENQEQKIDEDCLKQIAGIIRQNVNRSADIAASYNQNTFALFLPHTPQDGALRVVENIRLGVQKFNNATLTPSHPPITLSFGVETAIPSRVIPSETLLLSAERTLHQAIIRGTDQVAHDDF